MSEQSDLRDLGPEDTEIQQALDLLDHYGDEHWWFDSELVIADAFNSLLAERGRLTAEVQGIRDAAEIAYSEMAFAIHDISGMRLDSYEAIDRRAEKLSKCADELRAVLDAPASGRRKAIAEGNDALEKAGLARPIDDVVDEVTADSRRIPFPEDAIDCEACNEKSVINLEGVMHCLNCGASAESGHKS